MSQVSGDFNIVWCSNNAPEACIKYGDFSGPGALQLVRNCVQSAYCILKGLKGMQHGLRTAVDIIVMMLPPRIGRELWLLPTDARRRRRDQQGDRALRGRPPQPEAQGLGHV